MAEQHHGESGIVLYAALAANLGIAVAKFIAASITGSSSMMSEGFHSVVDSGNQILLLYGQHRSKKAPDHQHPFGYGRELYFWSFVVAILIFAIGAGVSAFEGYRHIVDPEELTNPLINYIVLAVSAALEGSSWAVAVRQFAKSKGDTSWWQAVRRSKDPPTFIVLFEDSAALAGLVVAAIGVWASHYFDKPWLDGLASIGIAVILAAVAVLLARESKGLLIGERADEEVIATVHDVVDGHPSVSSVNHVRTIHTGPNEVFAAISVDFRDEVTMGEAETLIEEIEDSLRAALPQLSSIYIRPESKANAAVVPVRRPAPAR
ncbi:cation diffusion facilitator family transporter [Hephaestia mangrovi]|uniref:cation diffusion facilitator family transporter n=1 Tax=Hephaestia mangrovi TaxID=2873268 RepID=UPI001CA678DB|nr:cation diffusion facilitator family transporter [Hephaestia mangrovi]MBY8827253.1 cation diffusion facilitator family transporter [Hephaestia mangrovi]